MPPQISLDGTNNIYTQWTLTGITLRLLLLNNSLDWSGSYTDEHGSARRLPNGEPGPGVLLSFVEELETLGQFSLEYVDRSSTLATPSVQELLAQSGSPTSDFTACAIAASLGLVDLCIGDFSVSESRAALSYYMPTHKTRTEKLIVRQVVEEPNAWDHLKSIKAPFTDGLWLLIGVTTVAFGLAIVWTEDAGEGDSDKAAEDEASSGTSWLRTMANALYESSLGMATGGGMNPSNRGGMWMNLGFTIFAVLTTASYTANLANLLVVQSRATERIRSIDDLIRIPGAVLCVNTDHAISFHELYPALEGRTKKLTQAHVIERIASGDPECAAGIAGVEDLELLYSRNESCNVVGVGDVLRVEQLSMPVSPTHHWPLSVLARRLLANDRFGILTTQKRPASKCPALHSGPPSLTLDIRDLSGAFALVAIFGCIGAMVSAYDKTKWRAVSTLALRRTKSPSGEATSTAKRAQRIVEVDHASESAAKAIDRATMNLMENRIVARLEAHMDSTLERFRRDVSAQRDELPLGAEPSRDSAAERAGVRTANAKKIKYHAQSLDEPPRTPQAQALARAKSAPAPADGSGSSLASRLAATHTRAADWGSPASQGSPGGLRSGESPSLAHVAAAGGDVSALRALVQRGELSQLNSALMALGFNKMGDRLAIRQQLQLLQSALQGTERLGWPQLPDDGPPATSPESRSLRL